MADDPSIGLELFNRGLYWEAHEAWEHEWVPDRKGPDAGFYKGLIQVAAGCLHYGRRNRRGAVNKWRSGAGYLPRWTAAAGPTCRCRRSVMSRVGICAPRPTR